MALISLGKKIAGIDVRIGIPPSKPQFPLSEINEKIGYINRSSNRNSVFNTFRSGMTSAGGFARPSNFMVTIAGPTTVKDVREVNGTVQSLANSTDLAFQLKSNSRLTLDLFCSDVSIPQRTITDEVNEQYYGASRAIGKNIQYDEVTMEFYTSVNFEERLYFEAWQNAIIDPKTYNVGYYDDYASDCTVVITPLTKSFTAALQGIQQTGLTPDQYKDVIRTKLGDTSGESAYQCVLLEAWPKTIQATQLSYGQKDSLIKVTIVMKYREFATSAINVLDGIRENVIDPSVKRQEYRSNVEAIRGGILDNLPFGIGNILGSVGRQVYEKVRRDLPIGRVTGGRVFPKGLPDPKVIRDILY